MPSVDRDSIRTRLAALASIGATDLKAALRDLGRDGAVDAADAAMLDQLATAMEAPAQAALASFLGRATAVPAARPKLADDPLFADVAAGSKVLVQNDVGAAVQKLQQALIDLGFGAWTTTQTFGPRTKQALTEFQAQWNQKLVDTRSTRAPLSVDGKLGRMTLAAIDEARATLATAPPVRIDGGADAMDVVVDLQKQIAWVNAALVDPAKLDGLLTRLESEPTSAAKSAYAPIKAEVGVDDVAAKPVRSEAELGLVDSDGATRMFVGFKIAVGERDGSGYLTPTGSFVVGDKRRNREGSQWGHPSGFALDPQNPFGPRWLRLYRETPAGLSPTAYGFHGTTSTATWMNRADGDRAVSHGCMRFRNADIVKIFEYLPAGARVRIVDSVADGTA